MSFCTENRCGFYKLVLFQKYCYNTGCAGAGCTEKLVKYLDDNNIGAYCKANEFGCEVSSMLYSLVLACFLLPKYPFLQKLSGV